MQRPASHPFLWMLLVFSAAVLAPVLIMFASVSPLEVARTLTAGPVQAAGGISLGASCVAVLLASIFGIPAGYELAHRGARTRSLTLFALALPLAFPPVASGILLLNVVGAHAPLGAWLSARGAPVVDSFAGVVAAEFFVSASFVALTSCAAFRALDPTFEESAASLGASPLRTFFRVALPLAAPNVSAGVLLAWLRAIGEYGATSIVAYHPTSLPVALYVTLSAEGIGPALALSYGFVVLAALVVGLQWALRRHVV